MKFKDKIVLVTGASQNTGVNIARKFLMEGAKVMINSNHSEDLEIIYNSLVSIFPEMLERYVADISNEEHVTAMYAALDEKFGSIDILINNACNQGIGPAFEDVPAKDFFNVINVNLFGTFLVSQKAVHRMLKHRKGGVIVNMGSNVSERAIHNRSAYVTSKSGIDGMTKAMAVDLGPKGIRVNTVAPGYIHTSRWEVLSDDIKKRRRLNIPLGQEALGDDIANAVLFLSSDESKSISGARLVVDGGCSAQHMPKDVDL